MAGQISPAKDAGSRACELTPEVQPRRSYTVRAFVRAPHVPSSSVPTSGAALSSYIMKRLAFKGFFVVLFLAYAETCALAQGTYTAASCNYNDVNACINSGSGSCSPSTHTAVNGDVINIPSGSCSWSTGIVVPSNIGVTVAGDGTPNSDPSTTGASSSCGNNTTITVTNGIKAFKMSPAYGNSTSRLSCMVIASGTGSGIGLSILGTCTSSGCPNLRMDNITFSNWAGHANNGISYGINAVGDMFGVVDHNTVNGSPGNYIQLVEQSNASYLGVGSYGDNSWAQSESYGSANFLFYENNLLNQAGLSEDEGSAGSQANQGGCRIVGRYNIFNTDNMNVELAWHGTESNGRPRSCRAWEFYENTINCPASTECQEIVGARGGTGLTWGNTATFNSSGVNSYVNLDTYRAFANIGGWGPCDGSTVYDTNDGITYYSGTISSYNSSTGVITVSGSPWTTNQWVSNGSPYSIHDVTQSNGDEITANGSNTITISLNFGPGAWTPAAGDSIQILRATACLDQAGDRGAGKLYSGSPATPLSAANEAVSPTYLWMLTGNNPGVSVVYADTARVISNRDYYTESVNQAAQTSSSSPFNGSSGMGHGTVANRPTTCTLNVAYWATDENTLYQCSTTNTWTAYYTPYTYPHPLTTGDAPPAPPTELKAIVN